MRSFNWLLHLNSPSKIWLYFSLFQTHQIIIFNNSPTRHLDGCIQIFHVIEPNMNVQVKYLKQGIVSKDLTNKYFSLEFEALICFSFD